MNSNFTNSNRYREKIHKLIPGGAHTYSKGDDQFPLLSPGAIVRGKGAYIWDVDENKYLDCSMGLTSVSLGHAYEPVLERVRAELENGVNFQRPSYIEAEMAETFLDLVPGHERIKFSKNGSTATTAAVKIARAHTGRKLVAFPGDHPFYSYDDWFIGKSACSFGVPEEYKELSVCYKGDDLESLGNLFEKYPGQIACVISEPEKQTPPPKGYLSAAIDLAHKNGALYIADEMVTGFKTDLPGSIKKFDVVPDMATWGKGIANGFSFCALTGRADIMDLGGITREGQRKLFLISTTHGGETHSLAAGLATIKEFKENNVIAHNRQITSQFISGVRELLVGLGLSGQVSLIDCEWLPAIAYRESNGVSLAELSALSMQECFKRGVFFQGVLVPCFSHTEKDIDKLLVALSEVFAVVKMAIERGSVTNLLHGRPIKPVFREII